VGRQSLEHLLHLSTFKKSMVHFGYATKTQHTLLHHKWIRQLNVEARLPPCKNQVSLACDRCFGLWTGHVFNLDAAYSYNDAPSSLGY
jgi:hypothetical protein